MSSYYQRSSHGGGKILSCLLTVDISLLYPYKPSLIDTPLDDMASQDKTPEVGPATLPTSKPKSPTIHGGFATIATPANNIGGDPISAYRRRSSNSTAASSSPGTLFAGLMNHKRGSTDAEAMARRQSFHDQKPAAGFFGAWWNKYTTGH
ncbi:hypothetical protein OIDMADRAFT_18146 [Oidiodendron maius Zn]|uniref:Conidiation-specific expression protein n=1 Tax=Oidiodendron maius (strain Zn) TaxID=913774 RepID=A0A0C3H764_OIDMZ|nr:hypothetical protein OIDMADRAFT_18146 [Oidiodendron maius Zn]